MLNHVMVFSFQNNWAKIQRSEISCTHIESPMRDKSTSGHTVGAGIVDEIGFKVLKHVTLLNKKDYIALGIW